MVRLFIPEGEGQHPLARHLPEPLPQQPNLALTPVKITLGAIGFSGLLALVGRSSPGDFLKITSYLSVANIAAAALDGYGRREINRAVFKMDNIEAKPGKLWERTKHWTVDDMFIGGGVLGTLLAMNPRALPGVGGWRRFLGAATVGSGVVGYYGAIQVLHNTPGLSIAKATEDQIRASQYHRLKENSKAQESLSRMGRWAFAYHTWPGWKLRMSPYASASDHPASMTAMGAMGGGHHSMSSTADPHTGLTKEEMQKYSLIQIEFNKGELNGPDVENGYRAYKDKITDWDPNALQDYLERLQEIRKQTLLEALYAWHRVRVKEQKFYSLRGDGEEIDIVRRELQLLNNIASDFGCREGILSYHVADTIKRFQQIKHPVPDIAKFSTARLRQDLPKDWMTHFGPELVTEQVRINWTRQKEMMSLMEQSTAMHKDHEPEPGTPMAAQFQHIREGAENMKKNVIATERLLKEFEEQLRRADEYSSRPKPESPELPESSES